MKNWGEQVVGLVKNAPGEIVLAAPFIKRSVVNTLLDAAPRDSRISIYTRWRPDEVAAGVSDLEVFDAVRARPGASLWLCDSLHAKYYRAGPRVLMGSANLTQRAFGWVARSNLELLVECGWPTADFELFESALFRSAVEATKDLRDRVAAAASGFERVQMHLTGREGSASVHVFLPCTRNPELLHEAYAGNVDSLTGAAREQVAVDLAFLQMPPGLTKIQFEQFVGVVLMQAPTIVDIDDFVSIPRRFGEVRRHIRDVLGTQERDPSEAWQTTMRWLLHFLPGRYDMTVARYSEIFSRRPAEPAS